MENENILNKILENTQEVKQVIIKEKKEKNAKQRAEARFKLVGTKLNPQEQEHFKKILEEKNTNANAYIKKLIFEGNNEAKTDNTLQEQNINLGNEVAELKSTLTKKEETITNKENEIEDLKKEIAQIEELGLSGILKLWFNSVKPWGK